MSNTLLDVSEAETGAMVLQQEEVAIDDLAQDLIQIFEPVALDKGLRLETAITPGIKVTGDQKRLSQALANLLDNAIKYTSSGGMVKINLNRTSKEDGVVITVSDTGIGINDEDFPHIFERHYRGDKARSGTGVGLGLAMVRGIVEAHGGVVSVDSQSGIGSSFRVVLPFGQDLGSHGSIDSPSHKHA
ncbi:MAG: HAMP domain-containing histidine kinase [Deltaproteobacteria bacterium]|nr:HAMP domain-containing histidine kinase [Deltaproteobacteria bacterium]